MAGANVAAQFQQKPVPIYATQWWSYSQNFVDILLHSKTANGDKRVDTNLGYGAYGEGDGRILTWPNKFLGDMSVNPTVFDCDLLYYRYAQAVMMHAELLPERLRGRAPVAEHHREARLRRGYLL